MKQDIDRLAARRGSHFPSSPHVALVEDLDVVWMVNCGGLHEISDACWNRGTSPVYKCL